MALSINSTVGELLDNAASCAILDKHVPGMSSNPQIGMARGMSLKMVAGFSGGMITDEILAAVDAELGKL